MRESKYDMGESKYDSKVRRLTSEGTWILVGIASLKRELDKAPDRIAWDSIRRCLSWKIELLHDNRAEWERAHWLQELDEIHSREDAEREWRRENLERERRTRRAIIEQLCCEEREEEVRAVAAFYARWLHTQIACRMRTSWTEHVILLCLERHRARERGGDCWAEPFHRELLWHLHELRLGKEDWQSSFLDSNFFDALNMVESSAPIRIFSSDFEALTSKATKKALPSQQRIAIENIFHQHEVHRLYKPNACCGLSDG